MKFDTTQPGHVDGDITVQDAQAGQGPWEVDGTFSPLRSIFGRCHEISGALVHTSMIEVAVW
ncbi:MAG TPA: hypothetical protein VFZ97_04705 [Acidimicrobiales bacterium]